MEKIANKYASQQIGSVFLYTHEAHPGENYHHLTSLEQKFRHAHALRDLLKMSRPILVDALDGACHRAFGSMPNMTWIFSHTGLILYKSEWTDSHSVENSIIYFLEVMQRRKAGERQQFFRVERLDFHNQDRQKFYAGLERNGSKAVEEFRAVFG